MIIDFCKTLAINMFWVLAAVIEMIALLILILGLLSNIVNRLHKGDNQK